MYIPLPVSGNALIFSFCCVGNKMIFKSFKIILLRGVSGKTRWGDLFDFWVNFISQMCTSYILAEI